MSWAERMRDSANAASIPTSWTGIISGYLGGGDPYRVWSAADWDRFKANKKLPIFVQTNPADPVADAFGVLRSLHFLGVPAGKGLRTALDLEGAVNAPYVTGFGAVMHWAGFRVHPYGQASTIFGNPPLDGYWVADYAGAGPFMYGNPEAVMTQYANPASGSGGLWDSSTVTIDVQAGPWWV